MTLPKIKKFTDFNRYPSDPQPTTDADMQEYMQNQNDILGALTKRLWQPQTEYKLGDIVASDTMADGLVAVCTISGVTSDIEPTWGVNEATVIDNSCTWIMRPAYCYGLATEGDVQTVHDGGSAEDSRLLSVGVLDKIFALIKGKFTDLFGSNDVLPITHGGTGATTAAAARNALGLGNTTGALPVANGGTGATTKAAAQTNLGLNDAITALSISGNKISYTQADGGTGSVTVPIGAGATAYVTETYRNGTNWYRKWSDGWIEQGGRVVMDGTVTYLKPFSNTDYTILALAYGSDTSGYFNMHVTDYKTTQFSIGTSYWDSAFWYAMGY